MKKTILYLLFLLALSFNVLATDGNEDNSAAGFDGGGGPGNFSQFMLGFLASANNNLVPGCFLEDYDEGTVTLATSQKSDADDYSMWKRLINNEEKNFIIVVVGLMENPGRPLYLAIEFDHYNLIDGNLVLDFEEGTKAYLYNVYRNQPEEVDFYEFYKSLCEDGCPGIHFLVPDGE